MSSVGAYAKAIVAAAVAGVVTLLGVKQGGITDSEWIEIILSTLAGGGFTWAIPNAGYSRPRRTP